MSQRGVSSAMRWSGVSTIGREASRIVFTVLLARLVGPENFGIAAQATVYVAIVTMLLDQGFSSALIQRDHVPPKMPGAVVTVNTAIGMAFTMLTIAIAPLWASFMRAPELTMVLVVLSGSVMVRSLCVTPRAMLIRGMRFRHLGVADAVSAAAGGVIGLAFALASPNYWAVVVQVVSTDVVWLIIALFFRTWNWPNLQLRYVREIAGFSWRAFVAGVLIISFTRNIDKILVGRVQGAHALALYGLAYRLLMLPMQMACATIGSVLFPLFSRLAQDLPVLAAEMARATRALALLAVPAMALVAAAAPQLVLVLFGTEWAPAIPIVQVLALAGALLAIYQPSTGPMVLGVGRAELNLRYAWLTTIVTTVGIVAGLPFGPVGVATGYTAASALLLPVEWYLRRHILAMSLRSQVALLLPAFHVAVWLAAAYLGVAVAIPGHELVVLVVGIATAIIVGAAVMRLVHPQTLAEVAYMAKRIAGRGRTVA